MSENDLERWDRRYREGSHSGPDPPEWIGEFEDELPREGTALDVAAGTGRGALWLAARGFCVTAVDVSPVGLERLRERAAAAKLVVETIAADLHASPLPDGPFAVITCLGYLQRDLFPPMRERLATGGLLICGIPTRRNLERHARPPEPFLLEKNELLDLCRPLEIVYYREGWIDDRCLARVIARSA